MKAGAESPFPVPEDRVLELDIGHDHASPSLVLMGPEE